MVYVVWSHQFNSGSGKTGYVGTNEELRQSGSTGVLLVWVEEESGTGSSVTVELATVVVSGSITGTAISSGLISSGRSIVSLADGISAATVEFVTIASC